MDIHTNANVKLLLSPRHSRGITYWIYHRLPERIHAHASICFMALILYRVIRSRLKDSNAKMSPEHALDKLRRI